MGPSFLKNLADLHVHLGATTSPHLLWELAHFQGLKLPEKDYFRFIDLIKITKKIKSQDYLKKINDHKQKSPFVISHRIQSSPYAVEECVHQAIAGAYRKTGITLLELRFNPMFRNNNNDYDLDKIILSAINGLHRATIEYPVKAGLIIESDRQFTEKQHLILAQKAVKFKNLGVIGFDVSGPNHPNFKIDKLIKAVSIIKKADLGLTIHTGEFTSTDEMWEIIKKLSPNRIGHGIAAYRDLRLMEEIIKRKITLEICPTSNLITQVVKNWQEMKKIIQTFISEGVKITINSDGPEFFDTDVKKEFLNLYQKKILTQTEIKKIISFAYQATFIKN